MLIPCFLTFCSMIPTHILNFGELFYLIFVKTVVIGQSGYLCAYQNTSNDEIDESFLNNIEVGTNELSLTAKLTSLLALSIRGHVTF